MAAVTEEDLQKKREKNEKLREQIAAAEADQAARLLEADKNIEATRLDAETARLEAQLRAAKESARVSAVKEGAAGPLAAVKDQLEAARLTAEAPVGPVDTNAGSDADTKNKGE